MNDKEFSKLIEEIQKEEKVFWEETYPKYNFKEKVTHWLASIHRGMRTQGETFGDEYSLFSKSGYEKMKEAEPDFDIIFIEVMKRIPNFDFREYQDRITKEQFIKKDF